MPVLLPNKEAIASHIKMNEEKLFAKYQPLIDALCKKGYASKGKKLADDPDFQHLCKEFKEAISNQVANYDAYAELKEKFEHLAVAYCLEADISHALD
jgi:hypothetical protein